MNFIPIDQTVYPSKYRSRSRGQTLWCRSWIPQHWILTKRGGYNTRVRILLRTLFVRDPVITFCVEDTRYTNPLKQKFKAKRLAAECTNNLRSLYPPIFLIALLQPMLVRLRWRGDQMSRCRTNTCRPTRFSSCRTSRRPLRKTNSTPYLLSTPTYTKFVSSRRRKTLPSSNTWTKRVPPLPKMPYITINWTGRTRSR